MPHVAAAGKRISIAFVPKLQPRAIDFNAIALLPLRLDKGHVRPTRNLNNLAEKGYFRIFKTFQEVKQNKQKRRFH